MRPLVQRVIDNLLARHTPSGSVDLNDIADAVDTQAVSYQEIEHIIATLEACGLRVGEPMNGADVGVMRSVIVSAHRLRARLRRRPTIQEISLDSGHPPNTVRRMLERGKSAVRVRPMP